MVDVGDNAEISNVVLFGHRFKTSCSILANQKSGKGCKQQLGGNDDHNRLHACGEQEDSFGNPMSFEINEHKKHRKQCKYNQSTKNPIHRNTSFLF